ncbi:MAG TPA: aminomethyltransferase family protein [Vicinamibacterales bacterium]|nr:aminomethyltransferase family protein [Vicinamibacterales bacterium]
MSYRDWSGYYTVSSYETHHEHEYNAIRSAAALIDISPLFKYVVTGPDASRLVDRVITRDVRTMAVGQVLYTAWCDERGAVIDDGTVARLDEEVFRWTAADPTLRWITQNAAGMRVTVEDVSEETAALALQGPMAARVLRACAEADVDGLRYFRITRGQIGGVPVDISRNGYTGDLGYEIWMPADRAVIVWDALMAAGDAFEIKPVGMLALDVARVEAGLLLIDVDFMSSRKAMIPSQRYTPFEMGMGRLVSLDKGPFVGRSALAIERSRGPRRTIVGLAIEWSEVEAVYDRAGLTPVAPAAASRIPVPVFKNGRQVGRATTTAWSPTLKQLIALATIDAPHFDEGTRLEFEITVEGARHFVGATVVRTPFFSPSRKTATPPA